MQTHQDPSALPSVGHQLRAIDLYPRVAAVIPEVEWQLHAPTIDAINELKRQKNAVILAHNYQTPEIFHGVADITGDSLALAQRAAESDAELIVLCGVHFMAETAKITCPDRKVIIPDPLAGCSLAESISPEDVRALRRRHPGLPVVTYVNTSAAVKAECDICCTSANAVAVVESIAREWGVEQVIFVPDEYLGHYVARNTDLEILLWNGHCEVHERFTADELRAYREAQAIHILAHPECPPEVLEEADYVGSTSGMVEHLRRSRPEHVVMVTECSMSDNVAVEFPQIRFTRPCNLCPHMKRITLEKIRRALDEEMHEVVVDPLVSERARHAVQRMLNVGRQEH